jgi:hypothetical protein
MASIMRRNNTNGWAAAKRREMLLANINNCREERAETAFDRRLKNATAARSLTIKLSGSSSEKGDATDGQGRPKPATHRRRMPKSDPSDHKSRRLSDISL